ncbi:MAG: nitrile hydratase subunit beta [Proteobacteria bacterium]|nr:nitrile hydratase subunit beta [Pseudomonadota bacterium]MDA1058311.1 nitrile hydratase subunit beta [Pseudomonadota bacterium]
MPGPHDLGGRNFGPVNRAEHARSEWDNRVDAILKLMLDGRRFRVDELRRAIESLPERDYMTFSYYEKWLAAIRLLVVEKGLLSEQEIDGRLAALRHGAAA